MRLRDKLLLAALIWLCVYPGVLLFTYGLGWLGFDLPLWLSILISTLVTVPTITLVASPRMEALVARSRGQTPAELKLDQARAAPGPDPEQALSPRR